MKRYFPLNFGYTILVAATIFLSSCAKDKNGERLIFSIEDDIALGNQVSAQTDSIYRAKGQLLETNSTDPKTQKAYQHMRRIVGNILLSNKINYKEEFDYINNIKIIKDDETLNAFATPGGHIYVFSGIIKYLDNEDQLAGVLGHEIAHADRRHTSKQLEQQYGLSVLLSIVLGENQNQLVNIAAQLASLKFSRSDESEADAYSVDYLGSSGKYTCDGAAEFFKKMLQNNQSGGTPEFLSTHPDPDNRVKAITDKANAAGCVHPVTATPEYQDLKNSLQ